MRVGCLFIHLLSITKQVNIFLYIEDISSTAKDIEARTRAAIRDLSQCDIRKERCGLSADVAQFDCVTSLGVLLTVGADDIEDMKRVLKHMLTLLKPGGLFIYGDVLEENKDQAGWYFYFYNQCNY